MEKNRKLSIWVFIGNNIDTHNINTLTFKVEQKIERKIRYLILTADQMKDYFNNKRALLIWQNRLNND